MRVVEFPGRQLIEPSTLEYYGYTLTPYVGCQHRCLYCYAQNNAEVDWDNEVGVIPDFRLRLEEGLRDLKPQVIYVAGDTDPYQPIEAEYECTRQVLEYLAKKGFSASILTKSDLVTRDFDILTTMPEASVGFSVAFNDEATRTGFEMNTKPTSERLKALREAKGAGLETYVLICPVMPHLTDTEALIEEVRAFADRIWVYSLSIESESGRNWKRVEGIVRERHPGIADEFRGIVLSSDHAYWRDLRRRLQEMRDTGGLPLEIFV
jgi:DNA repair photolyase